MNRVAMMQLRRVLRNVIKKGLEFDLRRWGKAAPGVNELDWRLGTPTACNTVACAAGFAAMDDWFQKNYGMRLEPNPGGRSSAILHIPGYVYSVAGLAHVFELPCRDAEQLFFADYYERPDDPRAVLLRVEQMLWPRGVPWHVRIAEVVRGQ